MSIALALNQFQLRKEKDYFVWVTVFAVICWLVVVVTIIPLFYGLLFALFFWLAHGLIIAQLKAESVLVTEDQMPVLYRTYLDVIEKLEVKEIPPLYVVQSHGLLNAFATRRSGRHFVVVFSDMLEACGENTAQIRFLLGHELGHVRSNHIMKKMLLLPGLLFPLIGSAYSRACETTCDRYGAYAAGELRAAAQAMLILAGGKQAWHSMDPELFSHQYRDQRGFFISWHELTSGYPTLSQRAFNILMMDTAAEPIRAPRNPFAYIFAFFSAGGKHGSGGNLIVTIVIIAVLMSLMLPALESSKLAAERVQQLNLQNVLPTSAANTGAIEKVTFCTDVSNGLPADSLNSIPDSLDVLYAYIQWNVQPGTHDESITIEDDNGKELKTTQFAFTAQSSPWSSWLKVNLSGINPRPQQYVVYFYLDSKVVGTQRIPAG